MTWSQSGLMGSGAVPIGASALVLDAPPNFTVFGAEWLRAGSIKAFDASYAASVLAAPQLRVFGNDARTYGSSSGSVRFRYYYVGGNYMALGPSAIGYCGTSLALLAANGTAITNGGNVGIARGAVNGTYGVFPHSSANTALWYTSTGTALTAVGGTFTTFPVPSAIITNGTSWLALSSLVGASGEQAYINAANPSGTWTIGVGTNVGITTVKAGSAGGGVYLAVGVNASGTGEFATCTAVGSAWTIRTAASGIIFASGEYPVGTQLDGTAHVIITNYGRVITTPDGVSYTSRGVALDMSGFNPLSGAASWAGAIAATSLELATDGAGSVVIQNGGAGGSVSRVVMSVSTDHGVNWASFSPYVGRAPLISGVIRSVSYANSRWIENHSGHINSFVDLGSTFATPDYIGQQYQAAAGQFVRIK